MCLGILHHFKQGLEDIYQATWWRLEERREQVAWKRTSNNILKGLDKSTLFVHVVQSGNLDEPPNVVGEQVIIHDPFGQFVPFVERSAIYTDSPFTVLQTPYLSAFLRSTGGILRNLPDIYSGQGPA